MTNLEKLYYNMHLLVDDYRDSDEVKEARDNIENAFGREAYIECGDLISDYAAAYEKQGFIGGFQYAVSLLMGQQ